MDRLLIIKFLCGYHTKFSSFKCVKFSNLPEINNIAAIDLILKKVKLDNNKMFILMCLFKQLIKENPTQRREIIERVLSNRKVIKHFSSGGSMKPSDYTLYTRFVTRPLEWKRF